MAAGKSYVIGVDAGGTGVRAALAEMGDANILGHLEAPSDPEGGPAPLADLLAPLLKGIPETAVASIAAGITKVSRAGVRDRWLKYLHDAFPNSSIVCVPDYVIAFHGALREGIGIAVVAGTGSVVYGENSERAQARVGGRGWEFGDEGSGSWLTTEMVRRTLRALDGMETATTLTRSACDFLGTEEPALLGEAARRFAVESGRGFLVPLALSLAQAGDIEAKNLFVGAAGWLAAQVRAAASRLSFTGDEPVTIAKIGGLWSAGALLAEPFDLVLRRYLPKCEIIEPEGQPLLGAIRLARRNAHDETKTPPSPADAE